MNDHDLSPKFKMVADPMLLIQKVWETSTKNVAAHGYIVGMIDGLRWSNRITLEEYNELYDKFIFPPKDA